MHEPQLPKPLHCERGSLKFIRIQSAPPFGLRISPLELVPPPISPISATAADIKQRESAEIVTALRISIPSSNKNKPAARYLDLNAGYSLTERVFAVSPLWDFVEQRMNREPAMFCLSLL
jgi:hypothetical protein